MTPDYKTTCKTCPRLERVLAVSHELRNALVNMTQARANTRRGARLIAEAYRLEGEQLVRLDAALRMAETGGDA